MNAMKRLVVRLCMLVAVLAWAIPAWAAEDADPATQERVLRLFSASPAAFIENVGQIDDPSVRYAFYGDGANVFHTTRGPVFQVFERQKIATQPSIPKLGSMEPLNPLGPAEKEPVTRSYAFAGHFVGAKSVKPVGLDPQQAEVNYYIGSDPQGWHSGVETFSTVAYPGLYEGIDLHTFGRRSSLKYEFHVAPGADWSQIIVRYEGIYGLSIDPDGALHVRTPLGELVDDAPVIWQVVDGVKVPVTGRYRLLGPRRFGFAITSAVDPTRELVIDPDLAWASFLGGGAYERGFEIACDGEGNALLTGFTKSFNLPTPGGFDTSHNGSGDAFVAKVSPSGALLWSSFLGGGAYDAGYGIACDSAGNALLSGETKSPDFPTPGGGRHESQRLR